MFASTSLSLFVAFTHTWFSFTHSSLPVWDLNSFSVSHRCRMGPSGFLIHPNITCISLNSLTEDSDQEFGLKFTAFSQESKRRIGCLVECFFVLTLLLGNNSYTVGKPAYLPFKWCHISEGLLICVMSSRAELVFAHERLTTISQPVPNMFFMLLLTLALSFWYPKCWQSGLSMNSWCLLHANFDCSRWSCTISPVSSATWKPSSI